MADGTWQAVEKDEGPTLGEAARVGSRLWAVCGCGRQASVDPAAWIGQGLGALPLDQLESRLRCACGARRVRLEASSPVEAAHDGGGIYVFR